MGCYPAILRRATRTQSARGAKGVTLVPVELAVDYNRDGNIDLTGGSDQTSESNLYRFWLNDDQDTDTSGNGDVVPVTQSDLTPGNIVSKRDLEDWARLWISFKGSYNIIKGIVSNGGSVGLQFEPLSSGTDPTPSIKICEAVESSGSTGYVTDDGIAGQQIGGQYGDVITSKDGASINVIGSSPFKLPTNFLDDVDDNTPKHLIFEGESEGKGKLTLVFFDSSGNKIGEGGAVYMDIKNVKKMYQHKTLGGQEAWPSGMDFSQDPAETSQAIVFVHGWRMSPADTVSYSETMFKRLWWRGFKGRFVAIRWDTYYDSTDFGWVPYAGQAIDAYLAKYNDSEHNAWLTGQSLANYVNSSAIPLGYSRNLVAHSMGNVVVGDALQQGMKINNYALLNAAIPAACYDTSTTLPPAPTTTTAGVLGTVHEWDASTPDDDPDTATQNLAYRGRLKNVSGNLTSFYLPQDYATSYAWEVNNVLAKPPVYPIAGAPDTEDGYLVFEWGYNRNAPSGQKLYKGVPGAARYLTDRDEANSYACRTWAKAVGAEGKTAGPIGAKVDLSSSTYGNFNTEHSAEFDRNIQQLEAFYNALLDSLRIPRNP